MRTMLLSFKADVYNKIITGKKIYEHRRTFPDGQVRAFIYVSRPIQAICGILYLSNKTSLLKWKEKYKDDIKCVERIERYLEHHKYGMEINKFVFTNSIPLKTLKQDLSRFIIPRSYYYIENSELLSYLNNNLKELNFILHSFDNINSDMICNS